MLGYMVQTSYFFYCLFLAGLQTRIDLAPEITSERLDGIRKACETSIQLLEQA